MVVHLLTILAVLLLNTTVWGAPERQLCLRCHPTHHVARGGCTSCHRGNPGTDRKNIAHQNLIGKRHASFALAGSPPVREGERLLEQFACRRCHMVGGRGNRLATDLDRSISRKAPDAMIDAIRHPAQGMPDFRMDNRQIDSVITALLAASLHSSAPREAQRQIVHFDRGGTVGRDLFSIKCGACHRVLTGRLGALGSGDAGPNLSGLLSAFYPSTYRGRESWNEERLREWLRNPRSVNPAARMQPIVLAAREFQELTGILRLR